MTSSETFFRIAVVFVACLSMSVVLFYRIRAASTGETLSYREEGYPFAIALRLAGLSLWLSVFAYLFWPSAIQWGAMPLPDWLRWFGVIAGLVCSALMYWTLSSLGMNLTDTVVTRSQATLVQEGPYRWIRHPFYGVAALLMCSVTLISASGAIGLASFVCLCMLAWRTPKEEKMLIERFGNDYVEYISRTGRFFPRLWG